MPFAHMYVPQLVTQATGGTYGGADIAVGVSVNPIICAAVRDKIGQVRHVGSVQSAAGKFRRQQVGAGQVMGYHNFGFSFAGKLLRRRSLCGQ